MVDVLLIRIFLLVALILHNVFADPSCKYSCSHDGYPLPCGVWLKNETRSTSLGTFVLNNGIAKLQCSFSSLPEPVQIQWMFRSSDSVNSQWREFPCSKKEERKNCQEDEIVVESSCEVKMNTLGMSGAYKCAASVPNHQDQRYRAYSSEFPITVVGIEPVKMSTNHLIAGQSGEINLEVCANPRPELFWHTADGILSPSSSSRRFAITPLQQRKILKNPSEPITSIPYCYTTSLLIHEVHDRDEFHVSIRGELNIVREKLTVRVKNSSVLSSFATIVIVMLFFSFLHPKHLL